MSRSRTASQCAATGLCIGRAIDNRRGVRPELAAFPSLHTLPARTSVISKTNLARLLAGLLLLPIAIVLLMAVGAMLSGMQDAAGARAMAWLALGLGLVWLFGLICLLLDLGINALRERDESEE